MECRSSRSIFIHLTPILLFLLYPNGRALLLSCAVNVSFYCVFSLSLLLFSTSSPYMLCLIHLTLLGCSSEQSPRSRRPPPFGHICIKENNITYQPCFQSSFCFAGFCQHISSPTSPSLAFSGLLSIALELTTYLNSGELLV